MNGKLAIIGLGSIGSMALWQASRLTRDVDNATVSGG
jgi:sarcosine oxidase